MVMMFSGGFFLSMLGIVRSWLVSKMFLGEKDESWYGYYYVTLAVVEVAGGVIFCSLPALKVGNASFARNTSNVPTRTLPELLSNPNPRHTQVKPAIFGSISSASNVVTEVRRKTKRFTLGKQV